jgi:methionine biosynthesis protein MetW
MEFKWNQEDRRWYFIEINPRLDFWIRMSTLNGVNLPLQLYLLMTSQRLFKQKQRDCGRYWIHIAGDLKGLKWRRTHKAWSVSVPSFLKPYTYFNDAIFSIRDPLPGLLTWLESTLSVMATCRVKSLVFGSLGYIFSQSAPLQEFSCYNEYWGMRKHLGTDRTVYPRFSVAMEFIKRDFSILDYGCGNGEFLRFLRRAGYKNLSGADVYKPADFPRGIEFIDTGELMDESRFDVITLLQVAEHVQDAEQLIARLLKLANRVIVSIPNVGYWQHRIRLLFGRIPITDVVFHVKKHVRLWTNKDFIEMCNQHNWQIRHVVATVPKQSCLAQRMPSFFARQKLVRFPIL